MGKKNIILAISICVFLLLLSSCATQQTISSVWQENKKVFIETETLPASVFKNTPIKSIAVMRFDAKSVRTYGAEIIDYIELANDFTDDVIKGFYLKSSVKVAVGEYEDTITETDFISKKSGDLDIRTSDMQRTVTYKAVPYKKIDAILSGRIEKFDESSDFYKSFIEISFKLVSSYDGEVYWITRMRGFYKDVIKAIVETVVRGVYTEPVPPVEDNRSASE